jgi:plasmid stability protein
MQAYCMQISLHLRRRSGVVPQLTIRDVPEDVVDQLRKAAKRRGQSLNAAVKGILAAEAAEERRHEQAEATLARMDALRERLREEHGGDFEESWPLIREDRDR